MRSFIVFILSFSTSVVFAQTTNFGASTKVDVGSNAVFYIQGGTVWNGGLANSGETIMEGNAFINNTLDNSGLVAITGNTRLTATSSLANRQDAVLVIEGSALLEGTFMNNGQLSVNGGGSTIITGLVGNNNEMLFEGDADLNGSIENNGLIVVSGNARSGSLSSFVNKPESQWSIEGDAVLDGVIDNDGLVDILGEAAIPSSALLTNNSGAIWSSGGDATLDGTISNNGELYVRGGSKTEVIGVIDNNNELNLEGDVHIGGGVNNSGFLNVLGNLSVTGTLTNSDGATSLIEGDFDQSSPFSNGGIIEVEGDAIFSDTFANSNEAVFTATSSFGGGVLNEQKLYLGGDSDFSGDLSNSGEIISFADAHLNFQGNRNLGDLTFTDVDRTPITEVVLMSTADSIFIDELKMDVSGRVTLPTNFVLIQTELAIAQGVLNTTNQENFLVAGNINVSNSSSSSPAYVEGKMLAVTSGNAVTFPMGINGFPNYLTLNSSQSGITVKVECKTPDLDSLFTDEQTMGLAPDVEWTIQSLSDSAEMSVSVEYSGVDFTNSANFINAREYDATLQRYDKSDSLFHALRTIESINTNVGTAVPTQGTIKTSNKIWITSKPTRFAIGLSPVLTEPEVYVPNVFTPGASMSDNQVFRPFIGGATVNGVSFTIFDSFNTEIFASNQTGEDINLESLGWDGNLKNGQQAPEGVYYYNISIAYLISEDVSDKYFNSGERSETQTFSKLGSVMLVK